MEKYSQLEISRIIGQPVDPRKRYADVISAICDTEYADPEEYVFVYDVLQDTDKVYIVTASGEVTQEIVTPDSPAQLSFIDNVSPEYIVKLTDLAKAKEGVIARKNKTINRAMNAYEMQKVIELVTAAAVGEGNQITLGSGVTTFNYSHLIEMIEKVVDYGDRYVLVVGSTIDKDIKLWDWTDDKNSSMLEALDRLGVTIVRVNATVNIDDTPTSVLSSTKAYLVATDTEIGRPITFVRKRLDDIAQLGGVLLEGETDKPERLILSSTNPTTHVAGNKRYFGVGITGFGEIAAVVRNPKGICEFSRV